MLVQGQRSVVLITKLQSPLPPQRGSNEHWKGKLRQTLSQDPFANSGFLWAWGGLHVVSRLKEIRQEGSANLTTLSPCPLCSKALNQKYIVGYF